MARLTVSARETIAHRCITTQFKDRREAMAATGHAMGMKLYEAVFDKKTRDQASAMPCEWVRMDGCLRFNCGGMRLNFNVTPDVPTPQNAGCSVLGSITGELSDEAISIANDMQSLAKEIYTAKLRLAAMLDSISTTTALEKTWPEGRPFYEDYLKEKEGSQLPAVQIEAVNKMLGLTPSC